MYELETKLEKLKNERKQIWQNAFGTLSASLTAIVALASIAVVSASLFQGFEIWLIGITGIVLIIGLISVGSGLRRRNRLDREIAEVEANIVEMQSNDQRGM
nr:hypothetical protein [Nitrosomonas nitrosa]